MPFVNSEILEQVATVSSGILNMLEEGIRMNHNKNNVGKCKEELFTLYKPDQSDFDRSFEGLALSKSVVEKLKAIYVQKTNHIHRLCIVSLRTLQKSFQTGSADDKNLFSDLVETMQVILNKEVSSISEVMIKEIKRRTDGFHKEAEASSDVESSGESSVAQKGHSPRAIAILEKIFSQTTNINRSEKLQLAKATRLEPRQVTIWFQNRRNRKPSAQVQSGKKPSTFIQQRKRKFDDTEDEVPQTPKQRRRLSETDIVSLTSPSSSRTETPFSSSTCDRSSSVGLFEISQTSTRSNGGTSCGTSYDDSFSSFQSEDSSPPRSTFGLNSFDDQIVRFTNAKKTGRSGDDKKEMMFNENGEVVLDWDDLELNLEDFNDSISQVATPNFTLPTNKQSDGIVGDATFPKTNEETNDLILSFARQLVEENYSAQQNLEQVQQSEGWQVQVFDKIFLAKEPEQDIISLTDLQSSQSSNPSGPSTSNSTQTSPRSGTPRSLFNFDFESLRLDEIMAYNNESFQQNIDSVNLFAPDEKLNFEPATSDILGLLFSPTPASASTDAQLLAPPA